MTNTIKENLIKLQQAEKIANEAEKRYEAEPESSEIENAFDEAYKAELATFMTVSRQIAEFAGIDEKTACAMVNGKRNELMQILA